MIHFELSKIWRRHGFLFCICALFSFNIFLLWFTGYGNLPNNRILAPQDSMIMNDGCPSLSSYRSFQREISGMDETGKAAYISNLKTTIDGISFVQEILMLQNFSNEMGVTLARQSMQQNPGVFEAYYDSYRSGSYLKFTDSLWQEKTLIDALYDEWQKVAGYDAYLQSIQETKNVLNGISIFGNQTKNSFSSRNILKSADDYAGLTDSNIRWMPGIALKASLESNWTDLMLLLSVFLFVGNLILEEKEKKLLYITRSTKYGILPGIAAKLMALWIHSITIAFVFYGANLFFYKEAVGFGDLSASLQSVAPYLESSLPVSIWGYILLSIATKGMVLFGFGTILTALCILADTILLPYLAGIFTCGISFLLYSAIPATSKGAAFKYLNLTGLLKTENLYGAYLNFNLSGYPISRTGLAWAVIISVTAVGIVSCLCLYTRGNHLALKNRHINTFCHFKPHASLLRHECYKIMAANKALVVLSAFGLLIGGRYANRQYNTSMQEQYYQDIMLQLEGVLTKEKESLLLSEHGRYMQAFEKIAQIDQMIAEGTISETDGEALKAEWYAVTIFYPSFQRAWKQYGRICEKGGHFLYDTGYLYLFGTKDDDFLIDLLLMIFAVILAFSNVAAMENQNGSWCLLGAALHGKREILLYKTFVSVIAAVILYFAAFLCRGICISSAYPFHGLAFSVNDIPYCQSFGLRLPVWGFVLLFALSQALSVILVTLAVLALSYWRKTFAQTFFFAVLLLGAPLVLKMLGMSFAGMFSVYPLYAWTLFFYTA